MPLVESAGRWARCTSMEPLATPSVACIILNWNGWRDTLECLASLARIDYPNLFVIVVDNGSTDGSVEKIRRSYPGTALIETGRNLGFGAGNNIGMRVALERNADYIWLMNNDAQPQAEALRALVRRAEEGTGLGAVGSVMFYADDPTRVQAWGGGKVNIWTGTVLHAKSPVADSWFDYLTAASILLRRSALQEVGLFDEGFFLYWEDTDLGFRLRKAGWTLATAADSIVLHKEHGSTGRNFRLLQRYAVASSIRFMSKHSPLPWLSVLVSLSLKAGKKIATGRLNQLGDIAGGIRDYFERRRQLAAH